MSTNSNNTAKRARVMSKQFLPPNFIIGNVIQVHQEFRPGRSVSIISSVQGIVYKDDSWWYQVIDLTNQLQWFKQKYCHMIDWSF